MRLVAVVLLIALLGSTSCSTAGNDPSNTAGRSSSTPEAQTHGLEAETRAPQPAGPPPGPFTTHTSDGVMYLTSLGGAGDAVAHRVIATVGADGCLYFETSGPHPGPQTEPWIGVIGSPTIDVTAEGLLVDSEVIRYGTPFTAGSTAIPPIEELPANHLQQCTGASQAWSIDIGATG